MKNANVAALPSAESPLLRPNDRVNGEYWISRSGTDWICTAGLARLFDIADAAQIVLVAKRRQDRSTYKVVMASKPCACGCGARSMLSPLATSCFPALSRWLSTQVKAGRSHVGVRIVSSGN